MGDYAFSNHSIEPYLFDGSPLDGSIKSVTFLATPHIGANGSNTAEGLNFPGFLNLNSCGRGCRDIKPTSPTILALNKSKLPKGIKYFNVTGFELHGTGHFRYTSGLGDDGAVEISESSNPGFKWRGQGNLTFYQDYVRACHSVGWPITGIGGVCDGDGIHTQAALQVAPTTFRCLSPILPKIENFILYGSINPITCHYDGSWLVTGSIVSNAELSLLQTGQSVFMLGKTDESGLLMPVTPNPATNQVDTFRVRANGYDTVVYHHNQLITTCQKIPMLRVNNHTSSKIMYPKVEMMNYEPVTTNNSVRIKVTAKNINRYVIWNRLDTITQVQTHFNGDSIVDIVLLEGKNVIRVLFQSAMDTVLIDKTIIKLDTAQLQEGTYDINLLGNETWNRSKLYLDNQFLKEVININETLKLLNGQHQIRLSKLGYRDTTFYVNDTILSYNINLPRRMVTVAQDSNIINFATLGKVQYWNGITVKNQNANGRIALKRYEKDYSNLRLIKQSETFEYQSLNPTVSWLKTAMILDVPSAPKRDSLYMLKINGNQYEKIFLPRFEYEMDVQKVGIDSFGVNGNAKVILMKRQKPIKNLGQRFQVHQSESFMIALKDLYKDPDALPNDMTYSFVSDTTFGFTVIGDSVRIQHRNCKTGDLSFKVFSTHDQYVVSDTFGIYVTPLTITTQMIRNARCFETATGRIEINISSPKRALYRTVWSSFKGSYIIDSIFAGKYTVTVTDLNDCQVTKTVVVTEPDKLKVQLGADIDLELGDSIRLSPTANRNLVHFKWTPRTALSCDTCENPSIRPLQGITYQLVAMDVNDCVGKDTIHVSVPNHEMIFIPNIFSPNGDGKNDLFYVNTYNNEVRLIKKFSILNRWGDRIFEVSNVQPNDPSKGWDGNFNGQPLSTGMYMYIIEFEFINGITTIRTGDINLMR